MHSVDWLILGLLSLGALLGIGLLALALLIGLEVLRPTGTALYDATGVVAGGATLLLAVFTGLLAWVTRRSIDATQREADIAAAALAASNRQADVAEKALKAAQGQAAIAERQVTATNEQARIAQEQLAASTRPMLAEPRDLYWVRVAPDLNQPFGFALRMTNIGPGPAFVKKALFSLGAAFLVASDIKPKIVAPGGTVTIEFAVNPKTGVDIAITNALLQGSSQLTAGALYHDISGERAWRSRGRLVSTDGVSWQLRDIDIEAVDLIFLD
jgi:membrane protein implicated in regulation of membrane protease activity